MRAAYAAESLRNELCRDVFVKKSMHPRVLVVAHNPIGGPSANGQTMSNWFTGWPSDRLAQVFMPFDRSNQGSIEICQQFWRVPPSTLGGRSFGGPWTPNTSLVAGSSSRVHPLMSRARTIFRRLELVEPLRVLLRGAPPSPSNAMLPWIRSFAPDVLYSFVGSLPGVQLLLWINEHAGTPIVPHFTDDWTGTLHMRGLAARPLRRRFDHALGQLLLRSPVRLVIGEEMADEYRRRYGGRFDIVRNGVADAPVHAEAAKTDVLILTYAGGTYLGRDDVLVRIAQALPRRIGPTPVEMRIFCPGDEAPALAKRLQPHPHVVVHGWVDAQRLQREQADASLLLYVESFEAAIAAYTRFSVSTKIAGYLMAARPIFAVGPAGLGSLEHLARSGGAVVVNTPDPTSIARALQPLLEDAEQQRALGVQGRAFAMAEHSGPAVRQRFASLLSQAASASLDEGKRVGQVSL